MESKGWMLTSTKRRPKLMRRKNHTRKIFAQISDISPVDIDYKKMIEEMNGTGSPRSGVD